MQIIDATSDTGNIVFSEPFPDETMRVTVTDRDYVVGITDLDRAALEVGYTKRTFHDDFGSDLSQWIQKETFSGSAVESLTGIDATGGRLLFDETNHGAVYTADFTVSTGSDDAVFSSGIAFGGGAFVEASLRFDPTDTLTPEQKENGWPAFWALGLIESAGDLDWTGQAAGYRSQVEIDFMESLNALYGGGTSYSYVSHIRHHYGIRYTTCSPSQWCTKDSKGSYFYPAGTDHTKYHRYGMLWVPATVSTQGYIKFFFDGVHTGSVLPNTVSRTHVWDQYDGSETPPPVEGSTAFNVLDNQFLVLILNSGDGMRFECNEISVWQANGSNNLTA